jgi:hypothetical protein
LGYLGCFEGNLVATSNVGGGSQSQAVDPAYSLILEMLSIWSTGVLKHRGIRDSGLLVRDVFLPLVVFGLSWEQDSVYKYPINLHGSIHKEKKPISRCLKIALHSAVYVLILDTNR